VATPTVSPDGAERAAAYLLEQADALAGNKRGQGRRSPPLPCTSNAPSVRRLASERIYRLPQRAVEAVILWAEQPKVELWTTVPPPAHVLALQARGWRCVSLLPNQVPVAPHVSGFEFAVHDLCHLAKFRESAHHLEQVGFFSLLDQATRSEAWQELARELDQVWRDDCDRVMADMNGSAIFLFAVLKMKLKMAVRRALAAGRGGLVPTCGALTAAEANAYTAMLHRLFDAVSLGGVFRQAAIETSTRRDCPRSARLLVDYFRGLGATVTAADARPFDGAAASRSTP
jgi:hypothetical protein